MKYPVWFEEGARRGRAILAADVAMVLMLYFMNGARETFIFVLGMLWVLVIARVLG